MKQFHEDYCVSGVPWQIYRNYSFNPYQNLGGKFDFAGAYYKGFTNNFVCALGVWLS